MAVDCWWLLVDCCWTKQWRAATEQVQRKPRRDTSAQASQQLSANCMTTYQELQWLCRLVACFSLVVFRFSLCRRQQQQNNCNNTSKLNLQTASAVSNRNYTHSTTKKQTQSTNKGWSFKNKQSTSTHQQEQSTSTAQQSTTINNTISTQQQSTTFSKQSTLNNNQ